VNQGQLQTNFKKNKEAGDMNEEELLLALEYLLLKKRIRERKQLKAKHVRKCG